MPVIPMKTPCSLVTKIGTDLYGQDIWGEKRITKCSVIKLIKSAKNTTVRADSSGTRGHADEVVADLVALLSKRVKVFLGDVLTIEGTNFRVTGIQPVFSIMGKVDHHRVIGQIE